MPTRPSDVTSPRLRGEVDARSASGEGDSPRTELSEGSNGHPNHRPAGAGVAPRVPPAQPPGRGAGVPPPPPGGGGGAPREGGGGGGTLHGLSSRRVPLTPTLSRRSRMFPTSATL